MTNNNNQPEVADVFRKYGDDYQQKYNISSEKHQVMRLIEMCRTAALGGHAEVCDNCGIKRNAYNSCRNSHCPKCQTLVKEKWLNARKSELLPCPYFHNVFTLPHDLNPLILINMKIMMGILFCAVKETLQAFAKDPQWRLEGQLGFISVLHTWNQKLRAHFHLHCIIPAGVLSFDKKKWIMGREEYLFKVESLAKDFQNRYLHKLQKAYEKGELRFAGNTKFLADKKNFMKLMKKLWGKQWITYSKRPFGGPEQVLEYLGRYSHRVGITNNRILSIDDGQVTFSYRDRGDDNKQKEISVKAEEFIRRFILHILPKGFMKIRYFGFLGNANKKKTIPLIWKLIDPDAEIAEKVVETVQEIMLRVTGIDVSLCQVCGKGKMICVGTLPKPLNDTT
jgi:hypothetical protein